MKSGVAGVTGARDEVEEGRRYTLNHALKERPVRDYLAQQKRYRHLDAYDRQPSGRTPARRALIRAISARFPGALRELDALGIERVRERARAVEALLDRVAGEGTAALAVLDSPEYRWLRYAIELQPRLR